MRSTLIRTLALWLALAAFAGGCAPGPDTDTGPSTPARGCHDNLSDQGARDVSFTGEPADIGNLRVWSSTDGSCSGSPIDTADVSSTVIVTSRPSDAHFLCSAFFGATALAGSFDQLTGPWSPPFGPNAYGCDPEH